MTDNKMITADICCPECGRPYDNPEAHGMTVAVDTVWHNGEHVKVTVREAQIIHEMMKVFPRSIERNTLFARVWGLNSDVFDKCLDVFMVKIRRKIRVIGLGVETIWGIGYKLVKL